jgi:hypothetical protein
MTVAIATQYAGTTAEHSGERAAIAEPRALLFLAR